MTVVVFFFSNRTSWKKSLTVVVIYINLTPLNGKKHGVSALVVALNFYFQNIPQISCFWIDEIFACQVFPSLDSRHGEQIPEITAESVFYLDNKTVYF